MPSFDFARFSPLSWFWLKPLSLKPAMSLTSAAVNEAFFAAGALPPPSAALAATVATNAATTASAIQRETFTCPPNPLTSDFQAILARLTRHRKGRGREERA